MGRIFDYMLAFTIGAPFFITPYVWTKVGQKLDKGSEIPVFGTMAAVGSFILLSPVYLVLLVTGPFLGLVVGSGVSLFHALFMKK